MREWEREKKVYMHLDVSSGLESVGKFALVMQRRDLRNQCVCVEAASNGVTVATE